ncbi:MAG: radical SAM protein [Sphaerochaetaceae bacterium]
MNTASTGDLAIEHPIFSSLPADQQVFLALKHQELHLTYQQMRMLVEQAADLALWLEKPLSELWDESMAGRLQGKQRAKAIVDAVLEKVNDIRQSETDYSTFPTQEVLPRKPIHVMETDTHDRILGRCPCPVSGEKTRCCNLKTLDAVRQCAFACSYCSIQSFYHDDQVIFSSNLRQCLQQLEIDGSTWHIGTGQSSDSLLWGDDHGVLSALADFARTHPGIALELKTKSARTDWIGQVDIPRNIIATWSLNAPTIIEKEEHLTATLQQRLQAARKAADSGLLVGFHLHPMVCFAGWREEYTQVVQAICSLFKPEEVALVSLGTLTFTKPVLRKLRSSQLHSRILEMELVETAGKYSYPVPVKQEMFSLAYGGFPAQWRLENGPFFYLCMELPQLWEPVFHRSYVDNASFEAAMRTAYLGKIERQRAKS